MLNTVLLVDDNELFRIAIKEFLTLLGLNVVEAENGATGLKKAHEFDFKILITDYKMPDMTGIEMIRKMKEFKTSFKTIIITGYSSEISDVDRKELGITAVIQKPVQLDTLEKLVTRLLSENNNS
jgi:DNA-binding NtrC family response regulator